MLATDSMPMPHVFKPAPTSVPHDVRVPQHLQAAACHPASCRRTAAQEAPGKRLNASIGGLNSPFHTRARDRRPGPAHIRHYSAASFLVRISISAANLCRALPPAIYKGYQALYGSRVLSGLPISCRRFLEKSRRHHLLHR